MNYLEVPFTQEGDYREMQKQWQSIGGTRSTFSMYMSIEIDGLWTVKYPNILDKTPLIEDNWFIEVGDWNGFITARPINNPTWGDIAKTMNANDGHHVFLEAIEVDRENQTLKLLTGS